MIFKQIKVNLRYLKLNQKDMIAMEWNSKLSVGIGHIDNQHKRLIDLFNSFYESICNKEGKEKMLTVIKGLKDYTVYHFKDEEGLMKIHNYPGYEAHKLDHEKFVNAVLDLETRYKNGKMILTLEISNFIRDWITKHIMNLDKQYTSFLQERGVK